MCRRAFIVSTNQGSLAWSRRGLAQTESQLIPLLRFGSAIYYVSASDFFLQRPFWFLELFSLLLLLLLLLFASRPLLASLPSHPQPPPHLALFSLQPSFLCSASSPRAPLSSHPIMQCSPELFAPTAPASPLPPSPLPDQDAEVPLVLVEGLFGVNQPWLWGPLDKLQPQGRRRRIIHVRPGPCSSLHDRACEIFYQLKGGRVDYGEEHSAEKGHSRYGRVYEGLYPQWSAKHPLHFLGHSLGGNTIYRLQQLLADRFFSTHPDTSENWIRSLTAVSSPFRGTTAVYLLGEKHHSPGDVRPFSWGGIIYRGMHLYDAWAPAWLKSYFYDFNIDHWEIGSRYSLKRCLKKSPWAEGTDNPPYDLTLDEASRANAESKTFPCTYYKSIATSMTQPSRGYQFHIPLLSQAKTIPLTVLSYLIGRYQMHPKPPSMKWFSEEDWWENDGVCPKISQYHPGDCRYEFCEHFTGICPSVKPHLLREEGKRGGLKSRVMDAFNPHHIVPKPGRWQVHEVPAMSHISLLPLWEGRSEQMEFWTCLFAYLARVDGLERDNTSNN
ncbi:uncharacterized protein VTP21DRAFT_9527 [Calcarisporiella thermophila]|uniref:uncharacterized protein n=1 Tax=Calcarisporiella thermophila TaxID=911321 RepID=UPI00374271A2